MIQEIIRIGTRNITRNPRRTIVTALSVALGACVSTVLIGTRQNVYDRLIANAAKSGYGVISISEPGFLADPMPSSRIKFDESLLQSLKKAPGIQSASPRTAVAAVVYTAKNSTGAQLVGIDTRYENASNNLMLGAMKGGARLQPSVADDCLVGSLMMTQLGLKFGDRLIFTTTDAIGQMVSNVLHVSGVFETGSPDADGHLVLMQLSTLQKTLGFESNETSFIAVNAEADAVSPRLVSPVERRLMKSVAAKSHVAYWRENFPQVAQIIDVDSTLYGVLLVFASLIIGIGVLNAMMLNIIERRREFGIMLATGMPPLGVVGMVAWEGMLLGCIGLAIGALGAVPMYRYLHDRGIDISEFIGEKKGNSFAIVDQVIGCRLSVNQVLGIVVALMAAGLLAGIYPAMRAATTDPIKVIRS
ncbi:MAG: ABC transporter permease [Deltaproteobacteria bacterium]|nr:ABC transporter permease [Deltaproteobacteria bacterium]